MSKVSIEDTSEYESACRILFDSFATESSFHVSDIVGDVCLLSAVRKYEDVNGITDNTIAEQITQELCNQGYYDGII